MARKRKGRVIWIALAVVGLGATAAWFARAPLGEAFFTRAAMQNFGTDNAAALPDGLHVILCGTGSPLPDPTRSGPCTIIVAGNRTFLIDAGSGAGRKIGELGLVLGNLDAVFLTHFHSDHIDGLGEVMLLRWAGGGRDRPLPIFGPEGVNDVVDGFEQAYRQDASYRIAHHGAAVVPPTGTGGVANAFSLAGDEMARVIYDREGVKVTAIQVNHDPVRPAVGYRFDYADRSVVISGDTAKTESLAEACNGCDILVHEALNTTMVEAIERAALARDNKRVAKIMADIPGYHTSPLGAAETAQRGKAGMLVLTHIVPQLPSRLLEPAFLKDANAAYGGPITLGHDGMVFTLPAGRRTIKRDTLP